MIGMGGMQVDRIAFSCAFGFPLPALPDMAKLTLPPCTFLTLPRQIIPIVRIVFPPFGFQRVSWVGKYQRRYTIFMRYFRCYSKCSVLRFGDVRTECLLDHIKRAHLL